MTADRGPIPASMLTWPRASISRGFGTIAPQAPALTAFRLDDEVAEKSGESETAQTRVDGNGQWREIFNSDATIYGSSGLANQGLIPSAGGVFTVRVPANSVLVFQRQR